MRLVAFGLLLLCSCVADAQAAQVDDMELRSRIRRHNHGLSLQEEERIFALHRSSEVFRIYDTNFNGRLDPDEVVRLNAQAQSVASVSSNLLAAKNVPARAGNRASDTAPPASASNAPGIAEKVRAGTCAAMDSKKSTAIFLSEDGNTVLTPLVRRSFADVFLFDCPTAVAEAQGAGIFGSGGQNRG